LALGKPASPTLIESGEARARGKLLAEANQMPWFDETVEARLERRMFGNRPCWCLTLWPAPPNDEPLWERPIDVVTTLPPDIVLDAQTGEFLGLKPLRGDLIPVDQLKGRFVDPAKSHATR
jgi:hypothetical protein